MLKPGEKIGIYEVVCSLGAGGMGEVYRARDTKLQRDVALKILPQSMARDAQRMARFEREAQVLASLNHPNIAAIYGLEESNGVRALVMELVEGQTLAERIGRPDASVAPDFSPAQSHNASLKAGATTGQGRSGVGEGSALPREPKGLPYDEALPIAKQIAEALEYAHERGVIHRDLKPANVKITPEGTVKVLDFGLAKVLESQDSTATMDMANSPTLSAMATQAGMILGTAAYMSPEQAKGQRVDRRADIWAFGCVLYEMLSGRKPFEGETISDVLAAVIRAEPEWTAIPEATPPSIQKLIRRCLIKDPRQRLRDIGEARIAIEETISGAGGGFEPATAEIDYGQPQQPSRRVLPWAVAAALMLLLGIAAGWWARARRSLSPQEWSAQMLGGSSVAMGPRISPDGHTLAFLAMVDGLTQVAVMDTHSGDWTVLTKDRSRGYIGELSWSPDGSEIYFDRYFSAPHGIYAISRLGGDVRLVLDDAMAPQMLPDGSLIVIRVNTDRNYQLYRFWPDSGRLEALGALIGGFAEFSPVRAFRDGKDIVFLGRTIEQPKSDVSDHLYAMSLASGKARRLAPKVDFSISSGTVNFPLAVASDDRSVLAETKAGDLYRIVSVPRNGTGPIRTLLSLTLASSYMDVDQAGNIYLDQQDRPAEAVRFTASGGTPQALVGPVRGTNQDLGSFQLPDGRAVLGSVAAGRSRLVAGLPGGQATPFIQTKEETWVPACRLGKDDIVFLLGPPGHQAVAVASIASGRIVRRFDRVPGNEVTDLAASPDGNMLYYVASRTVWAIAGSGGQPRQIGPGDSLAPDPNGKDLIVQLNEKKGVRLMKVPVAGGAGEPISIQSTLRLAPALISPNAVGKDGRVVLTINAPDSWFWEAAILDPRSGRLDKIPLDFTGDLVAPGWLDDGRILSSGWPIRSTLWRFRPPDGKQ